MNLSGVLPLIGILVVNEFRIPSSKYTFLCEPAFRWAQQEVYCTIYQEWLRR